ncbi:fibronectin type III domain containing 3C1-like, putative [Babesia ovata]|uniref:Fibronectin type III domain containing 3C1-like, putative n=1 Tax=Babesia ovata TaxID=189622 RepID=A0A2H6K9K3_9APIC|nr:fibronectin type III domain containing 3C1-like, putative [Babesia ovata]GBE59682.1 fibronectin type III domain containing 3C1-like, putative [Babesia ovata]
MRHVQRLAVDWCDGSAKDAPPVNEAEGGGCPMRRARMLAENKEMAGKCPFAAAAEKAAAEKAAAIKEGESPVTRKEGGCPFTAKVDGCTVTTKVDGSPVTTEVDGCPITGKVDGCPITTTEEEHPVTTDVVDVPLDEAKDPLDTTDEHTTPFPDYIASPMDDFEIRDSPEHFA